MNSLCLMNVMKYLSFNDYTQKQIEVDNNKNNKNKRKYKQLENSDDEKKQKIGNK